MSIKRFKCVDREAAKKISDLLNRTTLFRNDINDDIMLMEETLEISNYLALVIANELGWDHSLIETFEK